MYSYEEIKNCSFGIVSDLYDRNLVTAETVDEWCQRWYQEIETAKGEEQ